ncbi:hypothetical protein GCK72_016123 [Caenorhabditis remanei]|uniref:Uncharacterized protein n=1 Tax=Caenorhabditis remanei TaxID=31234 RepID=A0A6A5GYK4_CAERE|nr:hypothetical protein GCK72_016123 [Caenorhabditis remanei]KAF1759656.1 hypothetical protein GCK72_016123 [Caenorhabditis remanei]
MRILLAVLLCHVAWATVIVVPGDDDVEWCAQAKCTESQMCIMIQETQEVQCMPPQQAMEFVKIHASRQQGGSQTAQIKTRADTTPVKAHQTHCTRSELMRMGGRLVKWFKDIHSAEAGTDRTMKCEYSDDLGRSGVLGSGGGGGVDGFLKMKFWNF